MGWVHPITNARSPEKLVDQFSLRFFQMSSYFSKDTGEGADFEEVVGRYRDVVLAGGGRGHAEMTAGLACHLVAKFGQGFR